MLAAQPGKNSPSNRKREPQVCRLDLPAVVEDSPDAIFCMDLAGSILSWNCGATAIYGYTAEEMLGRPAGALAPLDRAEEEHAILQSIRGGRGVRNLETVRAGKGGTRIEVSLTVSPIRQGKRVVGARSIARDISERKRLESANAQLIALIESSEKITDRRRLEAANAQLAAIVQSSEDAIVSKDLTGTIQTWNTGAERVYGWAAEEAIGRNISFLLPPARANEEQEILATLRRGERVEHFETTRLRKDGQLIDVSLGISPIRDAEGRITGASHVARDVTEHKRFELQMQQAQRLESLGVLAGGIAHDFNNLLTGVIGNASLIAELLPPCDPLHPLVEEVTTAAERAAALTAQLLAYSGKGQFVIGPVEIDRLIGEISGMVKAAISKNVTFVLDLHHDAPPVEGDRTQIHQLIMNLILNGAEAIGEDRPGSVWVTTESRVLDEEAIRDSFPAERLSPGEYAAIQVRDNGCGMDEETKAKIFEPFFTTKFLGRGLGLAAALGIVNAHKGVIRVDSTPGEGTRFLVLLPASATARRSKHSVSTVLVVDDEEIVRKTAKVCLEKHGYRVLTAANGLEAVERFRERVAEIDAMILDLTMPVMGGEEALRRLREAGANMPVILSSGYTEADARRRFGANGLATYVQKPYTSAQLMEKLESVLRKR